MVLNITTLSISIAEFIIKFSLGKISLNIIDILDSETFCPEITSNRYTIVVIDNNSMKVLTIDKRKLRTSPLDSFLFKTLRIVFDNFKKVLILLIKISQFSIANAYIINQIVNFIWIDKVPSICYK